MIQDEYLPTIKETKLPRLKNNDLKVVQAKQRKYPENLPKPHFLAYFVASRGSGKTTAIVNFIHQYSKTKTWDHIVVFAPTCRNEPKINWLGDNCKYGEIELHTEFTHEKFDELRYKIDKRIEEYKKYERDLMMWKNFRHYKGKWEDFSDDDLLRLHDLNYEKPTSDYKSMPTHLILFDDNQDNPVLFGRGKKAAAINNFSILHRHKCCSIIWSCQNFSAQYGVPKSIRNNISLMCLWRNKSPMIQKEIAQQCSGSVEPEELIEYWNHATKDSRHDFLYVDYEAEPPYNIRKNFNTLLTLEPVNDVEIANGNSKKSANII